MAVRRKCSEQQAQIGPSCSLTALRMVHEYFLTRQQQHEDVNNRNTNNDDCQNMQFPSLLGEARDRGFTVEYRLISFIPRILGDTCPIRASSCHKKRNHECQPHAAQADRFTTTGQQQQPNNPTQQQTTFFPRHQIWCLSPILVSTLQIPII